MKELLERYSVLECCAADIRLAIDRINAVFKNGGKLLLCGNGGSASDCEHIVGELMKGFLSKRPLSDRKKQTMLQNNPALSADTLEKLQSGVPAISLPSFIGLNSAFCNDVDAELVYAQSVLNFAKPGDALLCISTSGNSKNCVAAAQVAKGLGIEVIALTGATGGKLKEVADVCIRVPETETYQVQELHLPVYHYMCIEIEKEIC